MCHCQSKCQLTLDLEMGMECRLTLRAADRAYALVVERGCACNGLSW